VFLKGPRVLPTRRYISSHSRLWLFTRDFRHRTKALKYTEQPAGGHSLSTPTKPPLTHYSPHKDCNFVLVIIKLVRMHLPASVYMCLSVSPHIDCTFILPIVIIKLVRMPVPASVCLYVCLSVSPHKIALLY